MERISVAGTIDIHIHTNPDLVDRIGDDRDIVRNAQQ